jgi:hypothetical protein
MTEKLLESHATRRGNTFCRFAESPVGYGDGEMYLGSRRHRPRALHRHDLLSYIHAEGYAAGELKHGPIALIDEKMPVIVIAPYDRVFEKTVSNMQEVAARNGKIILLSECRLFVQT